ncbi:MAG TPA: flippase [Ignavibacteriaceae bacterium]|nr:flippase [Ignavibacteriaceae bacterium]
MQLSETRKTLLKNFTSLSAIQAANYLIPLITLPYLVRVLGPDKYGLISFAAAFVAYFTTLTDYGFNLSAPRQISINRTDLKKVSEIFSSILTIKFIIFSISIIILFLIVNIFTRFSNTPEVFYLSFAVVLGQILFPVWFFQGMEEMKYLSYITISVRLISVVAIFTLVKTVDDTLIVILINSITYIIIGIMGVVLAISKFKIKFVIPSIESLLYQLKDGGYIFISTIAINLYTTTNTFLLGIFANDTIVGYFSAADKIRIAIQSFFSILSQTVYPRLALKFQSSFEEGIVIVKKMLLYAGSFSFVFCLTVFFFAGEIIHLLLGYQYEQSILVLRIISFLPFLILLSNIYGIQTMLNIGYKKEFTLFIGIAAVINIVISLIIVPVYLQIGTAISVVLTEFFVTASMILFLWKKGKIV